LTRRRFFFCGEKKKKKKKKTLLQIEFREVRREGKKTLFRDKSRRNRVIFTQWKIDSSVCEVDFPNFRRISPLCCEAVSSKSVFSRTSATMFTLVALLALPALVSAISSGQ
jgi:hypothetical protein